MRPLFLSIALLCSLPFSTIAADTPATPESIPAVAPPPPPLLKAPSRLPEAHSAATVHAGEVHQPAAVEEQAGLVRVSGTAQNAQVQCKGRVAEIVGDYLVVEIADTCSLLKVRGNANVVRIDTVAGVEVDGDDNAVTWLHFPGDDSGRKKPHTRMSGSHNLIAPGG